MSPRSWGAVGAILGVRGRIGRQGTQIGVPELDIFFELIKLCQSGKIRCRAVVFFFARYSFTIHFFAFILDTLAPDNYLKDSRTRLLGELTSLSIFLLNSIPEWCLMFLEAVELEPKATSDQNSFVSPSPPFG